MLTHLEFSEGVAERLEMPVDVADDEVAAAAVSFESRCGATSVTDRSSRAFAICVSSFRCRVPVCDHVDEGPQLIIA